MHHSQKFHPRDIGWKKSGRIPKKMAKMRLIFAALLLVAASSATFAADRLRIGLQTTGTFAWQLDVIRRHGLAEAAPALICNQPVRVAGCGQARPQQRVGRCRRRRLAVGGAGARAWHQIAVLSLFQRGRRRHGEGRLAGAHSSADLKGRVLAVAGGPLDKSWLIVQVAAIRPASISSARRRLNTVRRR